MITWERIWPHPWPLRENARDGGFYSCQWIRRCVAHTRAQWRTPVSDRILMGSHLPTVTQREAILMRENRDFCFLSVIIILEMNIMIFLWLIIFLDQEEGWYWLQCRIHKEADFGFCSSTVSLVMKCPIGLPKESTVQFFSSSVVSVVSSAVERIDLSPFRLVPPKEFIYLGKALCAKWHGNRGAFVAGGLMGQTEQ